MISTGHRFLSFRSRPSPDSAPDLTPTPSATRIGPNVQYAAWLFKRNRRVLISKRRFAVLEGSQLRLYRALDRKGNPAKLCWEVDLTDGSVSRSTIYVVLSLPKRDVFLRGATVAETERWFAFLKRATSQCLEEYYKVKDVIGAGTFGQVRLGSDLITHQKVAIKTVTRSAATRTKEVEFIDREIEVMRALDHPSVIKTYNIFDEGDKVHFVMEYLPGGDLFDAIAQEKNFSEANAVSVMRQVLEAVDYLHENRIVHRDLKPENILCVERKWPIRVKVTDFGTAKTIVGNEDSDLMATSVGTVYYMAPEQLQNGTQSFALDLWACGVILFAMLAGKLPFPIESEEKYIQFAVTGKIEFGDEWSTISAPAKRLVQALLTPDPALRFTAKDALNHEWITRTTSQALPRMNTDRSGLTVLGRKLWASKTQRRFATMRDVHEFVGTMQRLAAFKSSEMSLHMQEILGGEDHESAFDALNPQPSNANEQDTVVRGLAKEANESKNSQKGE